MLLVYLFATVVGGTLLGVSLVGGHHGDAGADHGDSSAFTIFSLRVWTYLLFFFGATGLLLLLVAGTAPLITALLAGGVGVTASLTARFAIGRALAAGRGSTTNDRELIGRPATVLVPFAQGSTGRVRLLAKGSTLDLYAVCDEGEVREKDEVLIIDINDGVAHVIRNPAKPDQ
jgi:membrane protein implicated in regulation of membrane protease activity